MTRQKRGVEKFFSTQHDIAVTLFCTQTLSSPLVDFFLMLFCQTSTKVGKVAIFFAMLIYFQKVITKGSSSRVFFLP